MLIDPLRNLDISKPFVPPIHPVNQHLIVDHQADRVDTCLTCGIQRIKKLSESRARKTSTATYLLAPSIECQHSEVRS